MKNSFLYRFAVLIMFISLIASCSSNKQDKNQSGEQMDEQQSQDQWQELFDGKTLNGWSLKEAKANFYVKDGMIVGDAEYKTPNCYLVTDQSFDNFILELDFKVDDPLNSGVQIRSKE